MLSLELIGIFGLLFGLVVYVMVVTQLGGRLAMAVPAIVLGATARIGVPLALTLIAGHLIERWQRRGKGKVDS